jgi:hypothetical protein
MLALQSTHAISNTTNPREIESAELGSIKRTSYVLEAWGVSSTR